LLPPHLTLDRHAGGAFLSLVALTLVGPSLGPIPGPRYTQVNLRTYVTGEAGPGIFILDSWIDRRLPLMARLLGLPVRRMPSLKVAAGVGGALVAGEELRLEGVRGGPALPSSLGDFLVERRWLYAVAPTGQRWAMRVEHAPWVLEEVRWRTVGKPVPTLLRDADGPIFGNAAHDLEVRIVEWIALARGRPIPRLQADWA
jgi:uncharacterized protein YqjF (DUF2071 family)